MATGNKCFGDEGAPKDDSCYSWNEQRQRASTSQTSKCKFQTLEKKKNVVIYFLRGEYFTLSASMSPTQTHCWFFKCYCDSNYSENTLQNYPGLNLSVRKGFLLFYWIKNRSGVSVVEFKNKQPNLMRQRFPCSLCLGFVCVWKADLMNFIMRDETMRLHKMIQIHILV